MINMIMLAKAKDVGVRGFPKMCIMSFSYLDWRSSMALVKVS